MNNLTVAWGELQQMEKQVQELIVHISKDISDEIGNKRIPGVTELCKDPCVSNVSISAVSHSRAINLSAEYWSPTAQARAVAHKLHPCKTTEQILSAFQQMFDDRRVKMSTNSSNYIYLNPHTLQSLAESELGKYVLSHNTGLEQA